MKRLALAIVFVLGFAPPAWADFQAGVAACNRGDYATALLGFRPLTEQGDAAALETRPNRKCWLRCLGTL